MSFLKRFRKDESGATAIEYGLIAALIAVTLITVFQNTDSTTHVDTENPVTKSTAPVTD